MPSKEDQREALVVFEEDLPAFPEIAWRGVFAEYREIVNNDPLEPGTPVSECPLAFHFANLLTLCASELGDNVKLAEGKQTFANLFTFCCGRTGTKKSTASDLVEEFLVKHFPETPNHVSLTSVSSGEGLIRTLSLRPNVWLRYDEVKDLFVTAGRNGNRLEPLLNSSFDLRRLQAIIKNSRDSISASNYYFNLLVNGTPDHVLIDLSEAFFKGGLLNRFLVFAAKPLGISKPVMGVPEKTKIVALSNKIYKQCLAWRKLAPSRGQLTITFSSEAKELHKLWYEENTAYMKDRMDFESSPLTRLDVFTKKVAMIFALMEIPPTVHPVIAATHMEAAIAVIEFCKSCMEWMTNAWTGARTMASQSALMIEKRYESFMRRHGCMSERNIYRALHVSMAECAKTTNAMIAAGIVGTSGEKPRKVHILENCTCDDVDL